MRLGVRLPGAPFPVASPETGYYGIPLLKEPAWTWEIPPYFFVGGAAGSAAVLGAVARWTGRDLKLARDCRYIAAAGTALSSALLISDLGRPARFLAMLRVFKPQSPMSVGAWTLAVFGSFSGCSSVCGNCSTERLSLAGTDCWEYRRRILGARGASLLQLHRSADWRDRDSRVERERRQPAHSLRHVGPEFGSIDSRAAGPRQSGAEHAGHGRCGHRNDRGHQHRDYSPSL